MAIGLRREHDEAMARAIGVEAVNAYAKASRGSARSKVAGGRRR